MLSNYDLHVHVIGIVWCQNTEKVEISMMEATQITCHEHIRNQSGGIPYPTMHPSSLVSFSAVGTQNIMSL